MRQALFLLLTGFLAFIPTSHVLAQDGQTPLLLPQEVMDMARSEPLTFVTRAKIPGASELEWQCVWKNSKVWMISTYCNSHGNPGATEITFYVPGRGTAMVHDEGAYNGIQVRRPLPNMRQPLTNSMTNAQFLAFVTEYNSLTQVPDNLCYVSNNPHNPSVVGGSCFGTLEKDPAGPSWLGGGGRTLVKLGDPTATWASVVKFVDKRPVPAGSRSIPPPSAPAAGSLPVQDGNPSTAGPAT